MSKELKRFAIVNPWPAGMSAELEIVMRMKKAAKNIGAECIAVDNLGTVLDEKQERTEEQVDASKLDFVISTHYDTPKVLDAFYYHTLWNPPEIPLNLDAYPSVVTNNYIQNDDYLIYDDGGMSNHLKTMLMNKERNIEGASTLVASFPVTDMMEPKLDDPKIFYCGMNWEKVVHNSNRHEGLFKLLDKTGKVKFFGPDKVDAWGGLRPWEGYESYQYSIPFDGFSILKEINECGICLVVSSDIHRRAGAVTNRAYEACAAGAVMISDDNVFMKKYFSDAALFIDYNKNNPQDTFDQIMEKYQWIVDNPKEALQMAQRAQEIFRERFGLEKQLKDIASNHENRLKSVKNDMFAKNEDGVVLVTYVVNTMKIKEAKKKIDTVLANIKNQDYKNIKLAVAADVSVADELTKYIDGKIGEFALLPMPLFDKKKNRGLTDGQAFRELRRAIEHDYFMCTNATEVWFYDHVTTMIRSMEDEEAIGAYSGVVMKNFDGNRPLFFDIYTSADLHDMVDNRLWYTPGHFIFRSEAHEMLPDFVLDNLDGMEHYAYANLVKTRNGRKLAFSKRVSIAYDVEVEDDLATVVCYEMQRRLICDMIKFQYKETASQSGASNVGSREEMKKYLLSFPKKLSVKWIWYSIWEDVFGWSKLLGGHIANKKRKVHDDFMKIDW